MKKIVVFLSVLTLILSFSILPAGAAIKEEDKTPGFTELKGKAAQDYIKLASKSDVYKKNVSKKQIKNAQAMLFEANENFPEDVVVVSGSVNGDESNAVQIFITTSEKEIVRVTNLETTGLENTDDFNLKSFDSDGDLRATSEGTIEQMMNGTAEVTEIPKVADPNAITPLKSDLWWACQFSSLVVCLGAAGVNVVLGLACRAAFKFAACSDL